MSRSTTPRRGTIRLARRGHGPFALIQHVGRSAYRHPRALVLRLLHRREFRRLHVTDPTESAAGP